MRSDRITELEAKVGELATENAQLRAKLESAVAGQAELKAQLQWALKQLFGAKSEKLDPRQLELLLGAGADGDKVVEFPLKEAETARRAMSGPRIRRMRLPEDLPCEEIILADPDEVRLEPEAYECIGREETAELFVVPPVYKKRLLVRRKWKLKADRSLAPVISPAPARLIQGSFASASLLADITVKKFVWHMPLYRQESILRVQHSIILSRKTMCDWIGQIAWWLKPVYDHIADQLRDSDYLQIDETPIDYCGGQKKGSGQGYLWVYHSPGGQVLYDWHTSRSADCLNAQLDGFGGVIQTDGYAAYPAYVKRRRCDIAAGQDLPDIELACCWAHARRKFKDAFDECPSHAGWILRQIQLLYRVERGLREQQVGPALRLAHRASESAMVLGRIGNALHRMLPAHLPKSRMGKAISYTLGLWKQLNLYLLNGNVLIDNNPVENAVRPTALGKKNWLFFGAPDAGQRAAIIYTLLENCKRIGIDPYEYLHDVLEQRLTTPLDRIGELTPANWAAARGRRAA